MNYVLFHTCMVLYLEMYRILCTFNFLFGVISLVFFNSFANLTRDASQKHDRNSHQTSSTRYITQKHLCCAVMMPLKRRLAECGACRAPSMALGAWS